MSDEPKKRSRAWIGWVLVAVFGMYPLSVGPVWWASDHFHLWLFDGVHESPQHTFYAPLFWVGEKWPAFDDAVTWYMRFFTQLPN
jgi:hypothetical protein